LVQVTAPSLRERASDIPVLAQHLAERLAVANFLPVRRFSDEALTLLASHCWPGNVWELEDVVHRAILLSSDAAIGCDAIVLMNGSRIDPHASQTSAAPTEIEKLVGRTVEEVERELILQTLRRCQGNRTSASSILGISVRTMRNKLKSFIEAGIAVAPAA
jgi:DNA-binding NtrC family response regulator